MIKSEYILADHSGKEIGRTTNMREAREIQCSMVDDEVTITPVLNYGGATQITLRG